jgi:hypothetical protein
MNRHTERHLKFNPFLKPWQSVQPNNVAGKGLIENPDTVENMIWQTRKAEPTAYENDFGDAIEKVFDSGATELEDVVIGLNRLGFRASDGSSWTAERLTAELRRLAD